MQCSIKTSLVQAILYTCNSAVLSVPLCLYMTPPALFRKHYFRMIDVKVQNYPSCVTYQTFINANAVNLCTIVKPTLASGKYTIHKYTNTQLLITQLCNQHLQGVTGCTSWLLQIHNTQIQKYTMHNCATNTWGDWVHQLLIANTQYTNTKIHNKQLCNQHLQGVTGSLVANTQYTNTKIHNTQLCNKHLQGVTGCTSCQWQDAPVAALPPLYCLGGRRSSMSLLLHSSPHDQLHDKLTYKLKAALHILQFRQRGQPPLRSA